MDRRLIYIILACCLASTSTAKSITYLSSNVARIAAVLSPMDLDSLHQGWNYLEHNGLPLSIRVNEYGQLEHIGIQLFPQAARDAGNLPVYDFIEQAYLKYRFKSQLDHDISDDYSDDVTFSTGSWKSLDRVNDSTDVVVSCYKSVKYTVTWSDTGTPIVAIDIPMNYDLILGVDRRELEYIYIRNLAEHHGPAAPAQTVPNADQPTATDATGRVFVSKGSIHMQEAINQDTYLVMNDEGSYSLLFDDAYPAETLINIVNAADRIDSGKMITIKFNLYGNRKETLTVPIRQLLAYSALQHETAYVGIERVTDDLIEMSLFLDNPTSGYEHVLFVRSDTISVTDPDIPLHGEAYLYSPTKK